MKKYTQSHEWIDDESGEAGITAHALTALGEIVFLDLPEQGRTAAQGDDIAVIESHKAASDIYAPVAGTVSAVNQAAADAPEDISDAQDIWLFTLSDIDQTQLSELMDEAAYQAFIANN